MTDTQHAVEPYVGCTFSTTEGVVIVVSSKESEPDGFGGFLYDLTVEHVRGGRIERMLNLSAQVIEEGLNRAEIEALEQYERDHERAWNRQVTINCVRCGAQLRTLPDKHSKEMTLARHYELKHSDV